MERRIDISQGSEYKSKNDYVVISREVFENLDGLYDELFADVFRNIYKEFFGGTVSWGVAWNTSAHDALWKFIKDKVKSDTVKVSTGSIYNPYKPDFIK